MSVAVESRMRAYQRQRNYWGADVVLVETGEPLTMEQWVDRGGSTERAGEFDVASALPLDLALRLLNAARDLGVAVRASDPYMVEATPQGVWIENPDGGLIVSARFGPEGWDGGLVVGRDFRTDADDLIHLRRGAQLFVNPDGSLRVKGGQFGEQMMVDPSIVETWRTGP